MPVWLLLVVMSLATYRGTRLITKDTFPPILWVRDRLAGGWREVHEGEATEDTVDGVPSRYVFRSSWSPYWLAELVTCPWCASAYVALAVTAGVALTVGVTAPVLVWFAVWGAGALLASREWA
jgi:hypothetical protein